MQASRIIKGFDEVKMVVGKTGAAEVPTDPMPPEATDMMIILKPQEEWKRDITYEELADEINEKLECVCFTMLKKPIRSDLVASSSHQSNGGFSALLPIVTFKLTKLQSLSLSLSLHVQSLSLSLFLQVMPSSLSL